MFNCSIILNWFIVKCMETQRLAYMVYVCDFFFLFLFFNCLLYCVYASVKDKRGSMIVEQSELYNWYWNIENLCKKKKKSFIIPELNIIVSEVTITFLDLTMFIIKDILICSVWNWFIITMKLKTHKQTNNLCSAVERN